MTTERPIDLDTLTLGAVLDGVLRGRPITVLGFARSGIALARFLADTGADVTVYDGRPAGELADAVAALEGRAVRLVAGPDVDPASALGWRRARRDVALDQPGLPDDRAAAAGGAAALVAAVRRRPGGAGARLRGGPVPPPLPGADRSASPARRARRRRRR